jgi:hypothetical protein
MSRTLQLDEESTISLRQELMSREKHELVAMVESSTAKEIYATRMSSRLLQRVAMAEEAGKVIEARYEEQRLQDEGDIWELATGGNKAAIDILVSMMARSVSGLMVHTGKARIIMSKFVCDQFTGTFDAMKIDPTSAQAGDVEQAVAIQYYVICQLANTEPKGSRSQHWFALGKSLYRPD